MKKNILRVSTMAIIAMLSITAVAALTYDIIDNDALSSSPGVTRNYGMTYGKGAGNYNGDYRITKAGSGGGSYSWTHKTKYYEVAGMTSYRVYLNNTKFTCTSTYYSVSGGNLGDIVTRRLNQDTAAAGWNYIIRDVHGNGDFYLGASVIASESSSDGYVGADACQMVY